MSQAASERQHVSVDHPTLGKVTGLQVEPTVTQFRGIKYATVNERFAECVIYEQKGIDATNWGPSCPQPADGFPNEQMFIQQGLPADSVPDDELNCLNLNITTPKGAAGSANPLPVLVFVHGGGLFVGADSWPHYDQAKLVALAASRGRPIVAVNLNYRLGAVGWLASPKEGLKGNFGANDVITAFEWIHKHISGFGGDPNNITALGNSAGSSIVTALLYQDKPLFKKIIPAGGTALLGPFADAKTQEEKFNALAGMLGIDATRKAFEKVSVEDLTQKTPMMYLGLGVDGDLFKEAQTSTLVAQKKESWCEEIFIGNNEHDASIMIMGLLGKLDKVSKQLPGYLKQALPEFADDIINTYKVSEDMSQAEALEAITSLATDVFAVATQKYLIGWPNEKRYFYRFAVPNPWDGPLKGFATHILEVAFLFQNYNHVLSEENRQIAEKLAESIIGFMYDVPPCKPWTETPEGREDQAFGSLRSGDARKEKILEIADKVGYEKLSGVMMGFYFGP